MSARAGISGTKTGIAEVRCGQCADRDPGRTPTFVERVVLEEGGQYLSVGGGPRKGPRKRLVRISGGGPVRFTCGVCGLDTSVKALRLATYLEGALRQRQGPSLLVRRRGQLDISYTRFLA